MTRIGRKTPGIWNNVAISVSEVSSMGEVYGKLRGKRRTEMVFLAAGLLAFSNVLCIGLNAQVSGGVLSGTVVDASQAAIPNVRVTLTNVATGVARVAATDVGFQRPAEISSS